MAAQRANQNGLAESLEALTLPPGAGPLRPSGSALLAAEGRTAQAAGKTAAKESVEVANKAQETGRKLKAVEEAKKNCPPCKDGVVALPKNVADTLAHIRASRAAPPGFRGGELFKNDGRRGGQRLPVADEAGNPIKYQEWDVNPHQRGVNRGAERLVTGSDGKAYYTRDHYETFTQVE
jgi:guanyl-specific ribonuclease Sa